MSLDKLLIGTSCNRWTILAFAGHYGVRKMAAYFCRCSCGNESIVRAENLRTGRSKSCGCYSREMVSKRCRTHGSFKNPLYRAWHNMINRCHNVKHPDYPDYGARGIVVCDRWRDSFDAFASDMGSKPSTNHSLDRRDTDGPYSPGNCRWATQIEQARNKRNNRLLTHAGETMPMSAWAERTGLRLGVIHARLKLGWTVDAALTRPVRLVCRRNKQT